MFLQGIQSFIMPSYCYFYAFFVFVFYIYLKKYVKNTHTYLIDRFYRFAHISLINFLLHMNSD